MRKNQSIAALIAALVLACGVIAWLGYRRIGQRAPAPVQAVAGASAAPSAGPPATASPAPATAAPSPTTGPVTYVPEQPTPSPAAPPTSAPTAAPTSSRPAAAPLTTPTPPVSEQPLEQATVAPAHIGEPPVIRLQPNAPPRIIAMTLSSPVASSGQTVSGTVETSSNVASVVARIGGYAMPMKKVGVGKFLLRYTVPRLPFFLHRTWMIQVIARNTRGDSVSSAVPITIR